MENLEGIAAVVTGAAGGMGEAVARVLAEKGCKVGILDINIEHADEIAKQIKGRAVKCDVSDAQSVEDAFTELHDRFGPARILVNCAGILAGARIAGRDGPHDLDMFKKVIDVNLVGTFNTMRVAASRMTALDPVTESGERGVIVNTASISAYEGQIGQAAYSASKGGVVGMTLPAARELAQFGVRVMGIAPGVVATPMILGLPDPMKEALFNAAEFPKRGARPEEIGALVLHIVKNEFLNGEIIRIDGATRFQGK
jgi:NAD(P)-dependent dehydrogenase (short-subunit alcohol dehydrogenase family)